MSKIKYLDIKIIKKYAKELRNNLVVELDGAIHNETEDYDKFRDEEMILKGLNVLRIKNEELSDMVITLEKIKIVLDSIP
jgi:very-short-patch-repair endonuclease